MRKVRWNNSHIVVEVLLPDFFASAVALERTVKLDCDAMVRDIRRHVNNVTTVTRVDETQAVCEFCGSRWSEDDVEYNGGCCAADEQGAPVDLAEGR